MPWSGSAGVQTFQRATGVFSGATCWAQTDSAARGIRSDDHDYHDQDMADGINACLNRAGGNAVAANIPMGGFKLTNMAPGTQPTDSVRYDQLPAGVLTTRGDMLYYGAAGLARLPKGTNGQYLKMGANDPQWTTLIGTSGATVPLLNGTNTWSAPQVISYAGGSQYLLHATASLNSSVPIRTTLSEVSAPGGVIYHLQSFAYQVLAGGVVIFGGIRSSAGVGGYELVNLSDYRFKDNIRDLDNTGTIFDRLRPRRFVWKGSSVEEAGFVAHEIGEVLPDAVDGKKDGMEEGKIRPQLTASARLIPFLVAEVKSLRARVAALEASLAAT